VLLFVQNFICLWLVAQLRKLSTDHNDALDHRGALSGGRMKKGGVNRAPKTPKPQIQLPPMRPKTYKITLVSEQPDVQEVISPRRGA
jgi:hypothetical protein